MPKSLVLIKVGRQEHLDELQRKGLLYMNPLPYFWGIEEQGVRGDKNDGVASRYNGKSGLLKIEDNDIEVIDWELRFPPENAEAINIFCMYALMPATHPIDERMGEFGDRALVFYNSQELLDRIFSEFKRQRIEAHADIVSYCPRSYVGEMGPFRKLDNYSWQSEWRLVVYGGGGVPRKIEIGDLSNCSRASSTSDLNASFEITKPVQ
jgi:hypothetical protein